MGPLKGTQTQPPLFFMQWKCVAKWKCVSHNSYITTVVLSPFKTARDNIYLCTVSFCVTLFILKNCVMLFIKVMA